MKVLYWNLNRKPLERMVAAICREHGIDVVVLSEYDLSDDLLLRLLDQTSGPPNYSMPETGLVQDPRLITRLPISFFAKVHDERPIAAWKLSSPGANEMLMFLFHLPSKMYEKTEDQTMLSTRWRNTIEEVESRFGHRRSIVVGDLNMDPFECGIIGSEGFHAVSSRKIAGRGSRTVKGSERFFFYNPMWSHMGEYPSGPPGSYYFDSSTAVNYYWHMFDQVLVRPDLLGSFRDESLAILTSAGNESLVKKNGVPDGKRFSDHLPVIFNVDLF